MQTIRLKMAFSIPHWESVVGNVKILLLIPSWLNLQRRNLTDTRADCIEKHPCVSEPMHSNLCCSEVDENKSSLTKEYFTVFLLW